MTLQDVANIFNIDEATGSAVPTSGFTYRSAGRSIRASYARRLSRC